MWAEQTKEGNISVWFHVDPHGGYRVPLGPMPSGQLLPGNRPGFKVTVYLVDGIRPVLGLQTEGAVLPVWNPSLPLHGAVQVVGRVELEPRLAGPDLKHSPTGWMRHSETHTHQRYQTLVGLKTWSRYQGAPG